MIKPAIFLLLLVSFQICNSLFYSQAVLIKDKPLSNFKEHDGNFGPNRKTYNYSYFGLGKILSVPKTESFLSVRWNALKVITGHTKKRQINKYLGLLLDIEFSVESFALKKIDSSTVLNYNDNINKARYVLSKLGGDLAFQFNLKPKRGNQLGTYITLGMYGDYNVSRRFVTKATFENGYKINDKEVYKKIPFINPFQYGAVAKFGKHYFDFFAKYRLSNVFDNGQIELPKMTLGVAFLVHGN